MATIGLRVNWTGTCVDGAESDLDVGGRYWYSININLPSGDTKDNALSRFQRWSLQERRLSTCVLQTGTSPTSHRDAWSVRPARVRERQLKVGGTLENWSVGHRWRSTALALPDKPDNLELELIFLNASHGSVPALYHQLQTSTCLRYG